MALKAIKWHFNMELLHTFFWVLVFHRFFNAKPLQCELLVSFIIYESLLTSLPFMAFNLYLVPSMHWASLHPSIHVENDFTVLPPYFCDSYASDMSHIKYRWSAS